MTEALVTRGPLSTNIEQVLIGGDLAQLKPDERLSYYNNLCSSLGLNPLTQPFQYIVLNNKLQLYAKKDCTEQLRKIHGVSITKVDPKQIGDLVVVVAEARDREGRVDSSTGAVAIGNAKGEDLANKMMKAETKAKRRVTLSLCGLGMLDETEVQTLKEQGVASEPTGNKWGEQAEIPAVTAQQVAQAHSEPASAISHQSPEPDIRPKSQKGTPQPQQTQPAPVEPQQQAIQGEVQAEVSITGPQAKRFFAISRSANLSDQDVKETLAALGYHGHRDGIPKRLYEQAVDAIDPDFKFHTPKGQ
jgi:hypothetical protein